MAQEVGYFQNNVVFTEGPFVIVNMNGWRIEAELKGYYCSVFPSCSVFDIMKRLGFQGKTNDKEKAARVCDHLNQMVQIGEIVLTTHGKWVSKEAVVRAESAAERIIAEVE